jgi:hypothetical protein
VPREVRVRHLQARALALPARRGFHSFTFRLNESAFCGIGDAIRGY